ncbi:Uncharacterized protein TCM_024417 [Theobroma cacao]|uniref:Uncharacterized protein n=1 Tax=Theobroma cacao TaxID=3641 RepID=A0A061F3G3_THECC|nr:Uncharacterized protein TCM_024417 [Theobroma cacao]
MHKRINPPQDILLRIFLLRRRASLGQRRKEIEASLRDAYSRFAAVGSVKLASKRCFQET